jgi:hypothetical protein
VMRPLGDYDAFDWLRLRPVTHRWKSLRYDRINERHMLRPPRRGDLAALRERIGGRNLLVTIAFGDVEAIRWQTDLIAANVSGAVHLIADNTVEDGVAACIEAEAAAADVLYVRLPAMRWKRGVASRSHGLALNWVWRRLVRPGRPTAFGFLDDDIFPTAPDDPFGPLRRQNFYGVRRMAGGKWFLWAGFCFFRFNRVADLALDFRQDWFNGLDTGGGNWRVLYQFADPGALQFQGSAFFPYRPNATGAEEHFQRCGNWLHEVGMVSDATVLRAKRLALAELLKPAREAAAMSLGIGAP